MGKLQQLDAEGFEPVGGGREEYAARFYKRARVPHARDLVAFGSDRDRLRRLGVRAQILNQSGSERCVLNQDVLRAPGRGVGDRASLQRRIVELFTQHMQQVVMAANAQEGETG